MVEGVGHTETYPSSSLLEAATTCTYVSIVMVRFWTSRGDRLTYPRRSLGKGGGFTAFPQPKWSAWEEGPSDIAPEEAEDRMTLLETELASSSATKLNRSILGDGMSGLGKM